MILIDSNVFIALLRPADELHKLAARDLDDLVDNDFFTISPVLGEVCFNLQQPYRRRRLGELLRELDVRPYPLPDDDERQLWTKIVAWLEQYAEHVPDWADAHLSVICGHDKRLKLWTYDREFHTIWRRPDGTRVPLATARR